MTPSDSLKVDKDILRSIDPDGLPVMVNFTADQNQFIPKINVLLLNLQ